MNMQKLLMCRICLVENVQMYVVATKNLQEIYEKLTETPLVTEDRRPVLACFFCYYRLKQCWRLQRKCLEAENLFARILNEDYETRTRLHQGLEFSGYIISPTVHVSISDEGQTESDVIKIELPDACDGQDDENQTESKNKFHEMKNVFSLTHHSESVEMHPQHFKSEDILAQNSEKDSEDDLLIKLKTVIEEEQEVSKKKRKATDTERATVAKKPKIKIRRTKLEDTSALQQEKPERNNGNRGMDNGDINGHRRLCIKEKRFICEICQRSFTKICDLKRHTRIHTGDKPYKCDICQRSFTRKGTLTRHIRVHTGDKPFKCDICQGSFSERSSLTTHIRLHTGEKPYKCEICTVRFTEKRHLNKHIRVHNGDKPYKCEICTVRFTEKRDLNKHILVHNRDKPYKCEICQRGYIAKIDLTRHIRVHTGETPYKCEICQRGFIKMSVLKNHIRVHSGEKPFKCDICQRSFSQKTSLTTHVRVHTGEKPYKCEICQTNFNQKTNLTKHIRVHEKHSS